MCIISFIHTQSSQNNIKKIEIEEIKVNILRIVLRKVFYIIHAQSHTRITFRFSSLIFVFTIS